jgi:hypothetical protein
VIGERAQLYRREQDLIARDMPYLFAWQRLERVALDAGLRTLDGPVSLSAPGWDWQLERMVLERTSP